MAFRYYDGRVDERYCLTAECRGGLCIAVMVNDDLTTDEILYDDYDYQSSRRIGEPRVDCPEDIRIKVREKKVLGESGVLSQPGDVVEVVKGRKYPIGMKLVVSDVKDGGYNRYRGYYVSSTIVFGSEKGIEEIDVSNVRIIAVRGGTVNQDQYNDVHSMAVA